MITQQGGRKREKQKTTLCVGFTLRRRATGGRQRGRETDRAGEREEMKGWGGTDRRTVKQKKERKKRNSGHRCGLCMLGCAFWFTSGLERETETSGEEGQLSD